MATNPTAGLGDPYWYEWTVGQRFIVRMLNPNSGIKSVTLQASRFQGLDDVIVKREAGKDLSIQVKHSREAASLTFSDIIRHENKGRSLLSHLATAWKEAQKASREFEADLFTNRAAGARRSTVTNSPGGKYTRPALADYWPHLWREAERVDSFGKIGMPDDWKQAHDEWVAEVQCLDDDHQRLTFIRALKIEADQPNYSGDSI